MNYMEENPQEYLRVSLLKKMLKIKENQNVIVHTFIFERLLRDVAKRTVREKEHNKQFAE